MRRIAATTSVLVALVCLGGAGGAAAGGAQWSKVNVCTGNSIGVRASQAGDAFDRPMFTRFGVQWFDSARKTWQPVVGAGSPWLAAGPGPWLARETGWTQTFLPGGAGTQLRGVVELQWRSAAGVAAASQTLVTPQTCTLR